MGIATGIFGGGVTSLKQGFVKLSSIPFIFILIAIQVYFLVNGKAHFPEWDVGYTQLILTYLVMTGIFLYFGGRDTEKAKKTPLWEGMPAFALGFIGTFVIFTLLVKIGALGVGTLAPGLLWPTIIIQVCCVAVAEELMFRGVLLEKVGVIISSILFSIWHTYAYSIIWYQLDFAAFNWPALVIAFIFGIILAFVARQKGLGLPACVGIHAAWNLVILGVAVAVGI